MADGISAWGEPEPYAVHDGAVSVRDGGYALHDFPPLCHARVTLGAAQDWFSLRFRDFSGVADGI
ncbi:MAG: hypothetical protein MSC45_01025 [Mobiluncus sp.]|uniref:hypothetical protein n=1 Tax=Mobiluncus sp. TaxID=47293 RepID=UPI00258F9CAF|nr:hypothetical protein [Mobiluncus sp.]MCI6583636.1 hypothetical protein [Mobiluncus sp.]